MLSRPPHQVNFDIVSLGRESRRTRKLELPFIPKVSSSIEFDARSREQGIDVSNFVAKTFEGYDYVPKKGG